MGLYLDINPYHLLRHGTVFIIINTSDFYLPYMMHTYTGHLSVILKQHEPDIFRVKLSLF
jgi:hypothetical protein